MCCIGALYVGPLARQWYQVLDKVDSCYINFNIFTRYDVNFDISSACRMLTLTFLQAVGSSLKATAALKKVALDQICFAPVFLTGFLTLNNALQGNSFADLKTKLRFFKLKCILL